jgi:outer membrane protein assembly factor BamB
MPTRIAARAAGWGGGQKTSQEDALRPELPSGITVRETVTVGPQPIWFAALGGLALVAACTSSPATVLPSMARPGPSIGQRTLGSPSPAAGPAAAWGTFDQNTARTGPASGVGPAAAKLTVAWHARLDGAVYGQPLVVGDLVIAATEGDSVYGLARYTGKVVWHARLGNPVRHSELPCGDIDPLGITGTPVYDRASGLVYALAEVTGFHHVLFGLSATTGHIAVERDIPAPDGNPRDDQQRPALTITGGRVYVAFGGLYGDCDQYRGSVVGVPLGGSGPLAVYVVPTARMGAIWGVAGPVMSSDLLFVSSGNGAATSGAYDGSDSVIALTPGLHRYGVFAPTTWAQDNAGDLDLGSTSPVVLPGGRLLAVGKRGIGYLLRAGRLGGVGGQIAQAPVCAAYGGGIADGDTAYEPCQSGGMAAVAVRPGGLRMLWRGPADASGSVTLGGGAVWVTAPSTGTLYELDPATGRVRGTVRLGDYLSHFASVSLAGNQAFAPTLAGVTAIRGA